MCIHEKSSIGPLHPITFNLSNIINELHIIGFLDAQKAIYNQPAEA